MSHFYGTVQGNKSRATRQGHKNGTLTTYAASYAGAVRVELYHDEKTGKDIAEVRLAQWHGHGADALLYFGPVDEPQPITQARPAEPVQV